MAVFLADQAPSWPNLTEAAFLLRGDLGISQHAWATACHRMGRETAAACIALIDAKRLEIGSPGGYLRALTARHGDGKLHLEQSFIGIAQRGRLQ